MQTPGKHPFLQALHHLLVERAGSSESRQTTYIATWLQGWDCCCRVTQQLSSKMPDTIETWCKNLQDKCPFATVQFIYRVCIYIYIIHHRHKTTYILFLVKKGNTIWDSRNRCFTMIKNPSCSNKCFSPLTYLKGSCVWPQSRDNLSHQIKWVLGQKGFLVQYMYVYHHAARHLLCATSCN